MTGEGEAAQAVTAGQAVNENRRNDEPGCSYTLEGPAATKQILDDYIQHSLAMVRTTQEQKLDKIDAALDAVEAADSRVTAVAALTRATVGINALCSNTPSVPPEITASGLNFTRIPVHAYSNVYSFSFYPLIKEFERKIDERIERYLQVADDMAGKYGPDKYQVSVGFPMLISITLTWNVKKE